MKTILRIINCWIAVGAVALLHAGIPEPSYLFYGNVSNVINGTRLTSGALRWTLQPSGSSPLVFETQLTNLSETISYKLEIPLESLVDDLSASSNTLPLTVSLLQVERGNVEKDGTGAALRPPASPVFSLTQSSRGKAERIDLGVIVLSNGVTLIQTAISGTNTLRTGETGAYTNRATFSNGQVLDVTPMTQWSAAPLPSGSVLNQNALTAGQITSNTTASLQANYQYANVSKTASYNLLFLFGYSLFLDILQADQTLPFATGAFNLTGTGSANLVGSIQWTNQDTSAAGTLAAATSWSLPNVALAVGPNRVSVWGTNAQGTVVSDWVTLIRSTRLAAEPYWWYRRGVIVTNRASNDYAAANLGQLKWVAKKTADEFNSKLDGGAGSEINTLVDKLVANSNDYAMLNLGQVKHVAKPFYDRLWDLRRTDAYPIGVGTNRYPWQTSTNAQHSPVNIGQLKYLFSFKLE